MFLPLILGLCHWMLSPNFLPMKVRKVISVVLYLKLEDGHHPQQPM